MKRGEVGVFNRQVRRETLPRRGNPYAATVQGGLEQGSNIIVAAGLGICLERLALVPDPGPRWPAVAAALVDTVDIVVIRPSGRTGTLIDSSGLRQTMTLTVSETPM